MATKAKVKITVRMFNFAALSTFASNVFSNMTGNLSFPTPAPTLLAIQAGITALDNAILAWGTVGNRGSHLDLLNLRSAAFNLYSLLVQEAAYVGNLVDPLATYADQCAFIASSGFGVKNAPSPQGLLATVENAHFVYKPNIIPSKVFLDWKKPLNLKSAGNVKFYQIFRTVSAGAVTAADCIGTTTKTNYLDAPPVSSGQVYWYWIVPVNAAGAGVPLQVGGYPTPVF